MGLNKKRIAYFMFAKDEGEIRLVAGDELKLNYNDGIRKWSSVGHVIEKPNSEEVALELRNGAGVGQGWVQGGRLGCRVFGLRRGGVGAMGCHG